MKEQIRYHVVVNANDADRTVLFDEFMKTAWTMNQITAWLERKFYGQWKSIAITVVR